MKKKSFHIKAVLFDFDGTLTRPGALDFSIIKRIIGCPLKIPVLEYVASINSFSKRREALAKLDDFEVAGARQSKPNKGVEAIIRDLKSKNLKIGIISRNSLKSIKIAFDNFSEIGPSYFDVIVSRDDPIRPKPNPEGVFFASKKLNVDVKDVVVVGDYIFDIQAGRKAGAITVLIGDKSILKKADIKSDFYIKSFLELEKIIRMGLPLSPGKFPNDLLAEYFDDFDFNTPSVLVQPGIGEDVAAIDIKNDEILILKSDPITFTTDAIGLYTVLINANDIATSGATPRWLLTTLFFPCGMTPSQIRAVMDELKSSCEKHGIALCGGHTEITEAVNRPIVCGMMAGTVKKERLINKKKMRPSDIIAITKAVAIEGTSIITREFEEKLRSLGLSKGEVEKGQKFLKDISILKEAQIAAETGGVSAMHDVTEGGLSTALTELSLSGNHQLWIDVDKIPIYPITKKICNLLNINPLGLIGSGSLLICCHEFKYPEIVKRLEATGIKVTKIGKVLQKGQGIKAVSKGVTMNWPHFEVDEITRVL